MCRTELVGCVIKTATEAESVCERRENVVASKSTRFVIGFMTWASIGSVIIIVAIS